jgi:hypothetical protein
LLAQQAPRIASKFLLKLFSLLILFIVSLPNIKL